MDNFQFYTILASIFGSLAWMISRMDKLSDRITDVESRLTVIETILQMMGSPVKLGKKKEGMDL